MSEGYSGATNSGASAQLRQIHIVARVVTVTGEILALDQALDALLDHQRRGLEAH